MSHARHLVWQEGEWWYRHRFVLILKRMVDTSSLWSNWWWSPQYMCLSRMEKQYLALSRTESVMWPGLKRSTFWYQVHWSLDLCRYQVLRIRSSLVTEMQQTLPTLIDLTYPMRVKDWMPGVGVTSYMSIKISQDNNVDRMVANTNVAHCRSPLMVDWLQILRRQC